MYTKNVINGGENRRDVFGAVVNGLVYDSFPFTIYIGNTVIWNAVDDIWFRMDWK